MSRRPIDSFVDGGLFEFQIEFLHECAPLLQLVPDARAEFLRRTRAGIGTQPEEAGGALLWMTKQAILTPSHQSTSYLACRCGISLISISHPTALAYFFSEVSDGTCFPADSRRETVLFVVPMREATASCVRPARVRAASISFATAYSTASA